MDSQRERLLTAMVHAVGEQGYLKTTIADVIELAGVSRKAFYEHFPNKEACFFETYDEIAAMVFQQVAHAYQGADVRSVGPGPGLEVLFAQALETPHAACIALSEISAVGPAGNERRERLIAICERALLESLGLEPSTLQGFDPVARAIIGGLATVLYTRLQSGRRPQLRKLIASLLEWISSYPPTSEAIASSKDSRARGDHPGLTGGRAPGTLSPGPSTGRRRGLRGDHVGSRSFVVHSQRERILDATARLSVSSGYAAITVKAIAEDAAVSLDAFYEHFVDKEDAFLVAYEVGHSKGLGLVEQAYNAASDWRHGVRTGITALFDFLASEPAFTHLALVDALIATPRMAERASKGVSAYAQMLVPGLQETANQGQATALTIEAVVGGIFELCLSCTLHGNVTALPELASHASYFALAPFIGAKQAERIAIER